MVYTKEKELQILAIFLNTIIPDDEHLTENQRQHLSNIRESISWDIAEKYGFDINNGYLDPITLEFAPFNQKEEI